MKIKIDNIAYGGYGVGRIDGKTVFVNYALPGDELEIKIYDDRKNFSFAKYSKVINPSEKRTISLCPNFELCGGCSYLNLAYSDEIQYKLIILKDQLKKIASIIPESEIRIVTSDRYHYRSHSGIKCNATNTGFYGRNSNRIIPFPEKGCLILSQILNEGIKKIKSNNFTDELKIAEDWKNNFLYEDNEIKIIEEKAGEFFYQRNIKIFFQSNKFLRKKMTEIVCQYSGLTKNDEFIDICSGCGFFTIPLSKKSLKGTGFDIDKNSIRFARKNASLNDCNNIRFHCLTESDINPVRLNPKTVIIDPPRSGISKKGRKTINALNPEIIVYISCNPSTFSRDIVDFIKNDYKLIEITLIDMFPGTHHIELISKLVKT